jgi:hypothetical protein
MPIVTEEIMIALCAVLRPLPIGTNLALLHVMWMLVSGKLLNSRGALFPGLLRSGLTTAEIRRAWAAFRYGGWGIDELLANWRESVREQGEWCAHQYEGYRVKAVDLTAFWRPQLKSNRSKHYHAQSGKALPAIVLGIVGSIGSVKGQRSALPTDIVRVAPDDPRESTLQTQVLKQVAKTLAPDEIAVFDAGFKIAELQAAGIERFAVRLAKNFVARRNELPVQPGRGRPAEYGRKVRPLVRHYRGREIPATPPDDCVSWDSDDRTLTAHIWTNLVLPDVKVSPDAQTFTVFAIYDPLYTNPLLVGVPLPLHAASVHAIYCDRWPIEQLPLAAKQMIGAHRQFVSAPASCQRLPELALLAGSILTYFAATRPAIPTGFWDRHPKPTPGRLRRTLIALPFPKTYPLPARFRKKATVTGHLLKGTLARRDVNSTAA